MLASRSLRWRSSRAAPRARLAAESWSICVRVRCRSSRNRSDKRFTAAPTRPTASPPSGSSAVPPCSAPTTSSARSTCASRRTTPRSSSQTATATRSARKRASVKSRRASSAASCSRTGPRSSCSSMAAPGMGSSQSTSSSPSRAMCTAQGAATYRPPAARAMRSMQPRSSPHDSRAARVAAAIRARASATRRA